jgi:hypothetical protein
MDDDLNLRKAVDAVQVLLSAINPEILKPGEAADVLGVLKEIDQVLNVLF